MNEETLHLSEPILQDMKAYGDLDPDKLRAGMMKEMNAMKDFEVYEEVAATSLDPAILNSAITTRFESVKKGDDVRARLVVQDYWREVEDRERALHV